MTDVRQNAELMAQNHGQQSIGAAQRVIAYTVVADGGSINVNGAVTTLIKITAAAHGLKKYQYVYVTAGAYIGIRTVYKVVDANNVLVDGVFGVTTSGNLNLTAAKDMFGFWCDAAPTIVAADTIAEDDAFDVAAFIAQPFTVGAYYPVPLKQIRISAGNITVVRQPIKSTLGYTNR